MSSYTTELRYICEVAAGYDESQGGSSIADIISDARESIFDFDYPIFDREYKEVLETKIIKHYYTREISEETVGLWKLRLDDKMNMIMPYYNKLYKSELLEFNPFYDVDLVRNRTIENDGEHKTSETGTRGKSDERKSEISRSNTSNISEDENSSIERNNKETSNISENESNKDNSENIHNGNSSTLNDGKKWDLYSDTPQGGVNGLIGSGGNNIGDNFYLTNARKLDEENNSNTVENNTEKNERNGERESVTIRNNVNESESKSKSNNVKIGAGKEDINEKITGNEDEINNRNEVKKMTNLEAYIEHISGKQGGASYSKMLEEFRQTFLNIDSMIINELSSLFFGLW